MISPGTHFTLPILGLPGLLVIRIFSSKRYFQIFGGHATFAGLIYINVTQTYTFTIGCLTASTVPQKFRFYVDDMLLIDSWTTPAATSAVLTGTIYLEKPADSSSLFYSILLEYSKISAGCHSFCLQWNMSPPHGPSIPSFFYALQVNCMASMTNVFLPEAFPTCISKSTIAVSSLQLSSNSEILVSITPKDAFEAERIFYDWTQYDFFLAKSNFYDKNPKHLFLSSKSGSSVYLSTIVSQSGNYQVVLGAQSQQFSVITLFADLECSEFVDEVSSLSSPNLSAGSRAFIAQHAHSCLIWRTTFRSKYVGIHTVILRNLSRWSAVQLSANDQMVTWNGSSVFSVALELKSHDILSLVITQLSDSDVDFDLQILEGRYFTDDPWSAKELVLTSSSFGFLESAYISIYNVVVVAGTTCHSRTRLQGYGLSVATEGSPAFFSIALQDAFDNSVEFSTGSLPHTASVRDLDHVFKASSQHFEINSCTDSHLGCVKYTPIGSGSFQMIFATGAKEVGLVATYFSDLSQSIAVASTFGLTEIVVNVNPIVPNSEFAIRWSGFFQKPTQATLTFSSAIISEFETVFVWIDNALLFVQESIIPITATMTFENILSHYEIEVLYTKRSSSSPFGFLFSANQAISYFNSFDNTPSKNIGVFSFPSQVLAFFPSIARTSSSAIVTIFGRQLSSSCSYICTWTDGSNQRCPLKSEWQVLISPNILLCGTPSSTALQGQTTVQVIESCSLRVRSLQSSQGLSNSNNFIFQSRIVHSNVHIISRSQRFQISAELLVSGTDILSDAGTACIMTGRSSVNDAEDYFGPIAVNSGIASQKLDNVLACSGFGLGEWNGVGQISLSVDDSLCFVTGSASVLLSGLITLKFQSSKCCDKYANAASPIDSPVIFGIFPQNGPVSGGSLITLKGRYLFLEI